MSHKTPIFAFVDIETTGSRSNLDRITEVGVVTLENDEIFEWSSLINPDAYIPKNIQRLTGITPEMVATRPTFQEIASDLYVQLKDKVFIAHNARFDYGFLRAEFKRVGIDFSPKVLCTVKLSRKLFPNQSRHNLDTIIQVHDLKVKNRHRALGDAQLLYQFWQKCELMFGADFLMSEVRNLLGQTTLPSHIDQEMVDELPHKPGVYIFYSENRQPLYIGKSIDIKTRVKGHFNSALSNRKEMKLTLQVRDVDWIETGGELGALLLESRLIKEKLPTFNIKLRRSKELCAWRLDESNEHIRPFLTRHQEISRGEFNGLYGLYYSQREALKSLQVIAKKNQLCEGLLGFEKLKSGSPCFGFYVKQCKGACIGQESALIHNLRIKTSLQKLKIESWPYPGPIGIQEGSDLHIFDHWCYLGSAINESEVFELLSDGRAEFDLDIYKIIKKTIKTKSENSVLQLERPKKVVFTHDVD